MRYGPVRFAVAALAAASVVVAGAASVRAEAIRAGDEIGVRTVGGMKIEAELEQPEAMQMLMGGSWMIQQPASGETHHFEVVLEDPRFGGRIPYAGVSARFVSQATKASFTKRLEPMYGKNLHYGANVALAPGGYRVTISVRPPALARVGEAVNRWLKPVSATFAFEVGR